MSQPIKVLLVEDSPVAMSILRRMLESAPELDVVGTASNGNEALALIDRIQPQVMCTDLQMPGMDGMTLIKKVMASYPLPILVFSDIVQKDQVDNIFSALQAGAMEVIPKPTVITGADQEAMKRTLVMKIRVLATKTAIAKV